MEPQDSAKKQYYGLDITKTVMAVLVIMIHRTPFANSTVNFVVKNIFGRLAVPFFFAAAGYLLFLKMQEDKSKNNKVFFQYFKRLVILYIVWTFLYMPAAAYRFDFGTYGIIKFFLNYAKRSVLQVSIIHLWYILALAVAVSVVYLLSKKIKVWSILVVGLLIFYLYISVTEFWQITGKYRAFSLLKAGIAAIPVDGIRNGIFLGLVFFALGAFLATRGICLKPAAKIFLTVFCLLLYVAEGIVRKKAGLTNGLDVSVTQVPAVFMLMVCATQARLKPKKAYALMRQSNSLIYFSHLLIITEWYHLIFDGTKLEG